MNICLNDLAYSTEIVAYLKVFYPLEHIEVNDEEQPLLTIHITESTIEVAYFHEKECVYSLEEEHQKIFGSLEGKEKVIKGKNYLKGLLYDMCSRETGITPPWGILIGIRPTKLTYRLLEELGSPDLVIDKLVVDYKLQEEKARLLMEVLENEMPVLHTDEQKHSIYIGIPFCPTRCVYCSFTSYSKGSFKKAYNFYTKALIKEIIAFESVFKNIRSIYVGGGTPTSLREEDFELLLKTVRELLGDQDIEFTVEAGRVDSITENKLAVMKKYGVNRISINPQTCNDNTLKRIGRKHTFKDVVFRFNQAREYGFEHINMDMILGLPGENYEDTEETINALLDLHPESITVHTMALKRGALLNEQTKEDLITHSETINKMLLNSQNRLKKAGYKGYYLYRQKNMVGNYENVGYCLDGNECIYNIHTMEEKESIIAFGAGAISKRVRGKKLMRFDQPKDVNQYLNNLDHMIEKKKRFFEQEK